MLLHGFVPASRANGPGLRAVVYFKGCSLRGLDFRETPSSITQYSFRGNLLLDFGRLLGLIAASLPLAQLGFDISGPTVPRYLQRLKHRTDQATTKL